MTRNTVLNCSYMIPYFDNGATDMLKQTTFALTTAMLCTAASADFGDRVGTQYVNLAAGASMLNDTDFEAGTAIAPLTVDNEYDTGYVISAETGYNFGPLYFIDNVKLGLEVAYSENDIDVHSAGGTDLTGSTGDLDAFTFMANMSHEYDTGTKFVPYYGLGVGVAAIDANNFGVDALPNALDDGDESFVYQGNVGVNYMVSPALDMGVNYRYAATAGLELTGAGGTTSDFDYESNNLTFNLNYRY